MGEASSVPGFIKPGKLTVETAVAAQHLLESPKVVPVPEKELGVTMNVGSQGLVESDEIFISALGLTELARCRAALQALDCINIRLTIRIGVRVPLGANAGVGAGALPLLELLELLVQIAGGDREKRRNDVGKHELRNLVLGVLDVLDVLDSSDGGVYTSTGFLKR